MRYGDITNSDIYQYDKHSGQWSSRWGPSESFTDKAIKAYEGLAREIMATLRNDCRPWFHMSEGVPGFRGMRVSDTTNQNTKLFLQKSVRSDRTTKDSPEELTDAIDDSLNRLGYDFIHRRNALFIGGDRAESTSYGRAFRVFPIGDFQFVWNPHIRDPWSNYDSNEYHAPNLSREEAKQSIMIDMKLQYKNYAERLTSMAPFKKPLDFETWLSDELGADSFEDTIDFVLEKEPKTFDPEYFWEKAGKYYTNEDLKSGLESGHEVMIRVDNYYTVYNDFYNKFIGEF